MKSLAIVVTLGILLGFPAWGAENLRVWFDGTQTGLFEVHEGRGICQGKGEGLFLGEAPSRHALAWRFLLPAGGSPENVELVFSPQEFLPGEILVMEARNLGTETLRFQARLANYGEGFACGNAFRVWASPYSRELPADGAWHRLEYPWDARTWLPGDPEFPTPVGPLNRIDFIAVGVAAGVPLDVEIRQIATRDSVPCVPVPDPAWKLPPVLPAGEPLELPGCTVSFQGRTPIENRCRLLLHPLTAPSGQCPVECPLEDVEREATAWRIPPQSVPLTPYLFDGRYQVSLLCGEGECVLGEAEVTQGVSPSGLAEFRRGVWKGGPMVFQGETPLPMVMKATFVHGGEHRGPRLFSRLGVDQFSFDATATDNTTMLHCACVNPAPGVYDYRQLDQRVMDYLAVNPHAYLLPRVYLSAPAWWLQRHPDAQVRFSDNEGHLFVSHAHFGRPLPSWSSPEWRDYAADSLRRLVDHIARAPYASRIMGLFLCSGVTQEWMQWGDSSPYMGDYSPAAQGAFRQWLREKYGDDQGLRRAWGDPEASLSTVTLPTRAQRERILPESLDLRSPRDAADRKCVDHALWNGEMTAATIAQMCRAVKEASQGRLLAGAFYGYLLELCGSQRLVNSGHLGFGQLLDCPDVDFLAAPTGYCFREPGGAGIPYQMSPTASLRLHDKFWWVEMDVRTAATNAPPGYAGKGGNVEEDILQQDKEAIHSLCSGYAQWWLDVGYLNFEDETLQNHLARLVPLLKEGMLQWDRTSRAQIAMVLQEEAYAWGRLPNAMMVDGTTYQLSFLERLGAPVEYYSARDLGRLPDRIRLVILPQLLLDAPEIRQALETLRGQGRVIVTYHFPGLLAGEEAQPAESELSGIPVRLAFRREEGTPRRVADGWLFGPQDQGRSLKMSYWAPRKNALAPVPVVREELLSADCRVIARYDDGTAAGAIRKGRDSWDVYLALPYVDRAFYEATARLAGVHRYLDTPDQVWATAELLGVSVDQAGERCLRLPPPYPESLWDPMTGERFPVNRQGEAIVPFARGATRLLVRESTSP
ncbi:MAG: beta-galactosidase [Oligosphaeraceae bacterium]